MAAKTIDANNDSYTGATATGLTAAETALRFQTIASSDFREGLAGALFARREQSSVPGPRTRSSRR